MPMNTDAEKHLLNNYWWALESIETKGCNGMKSVMSRLKKHVLISFYNSSFSIRFFKQEDIFFIQAFIHFIGTAIFKNKGWLNVFLVSMLNRKFVLLDMHSQ